MGEKWIKSLGVWFIAPSIEKNEIRQWVFGIDYALWLNITVQDTDCLNVEGLAVVGSSTTWKYDFWEKFIFLQPRLIGDRNEKIQNVQHCCSSGFLMIFSISFEYATVMMDISKFKNMQHFRLLPYMLKTTFLMFSVKFKKKIKIFSSQHFHMLVSVWINDFLQYLRVTAKKIIHASCFNTTVTIFFKEFSKWFNSWF